MSLQVPQVGELLPANVARVALALVDFPVLVEVLGPHEPLVADLAHVGPLPGVGLDVAVQVPLVWESFPARLALVRFGFLRVTLLDVFLEIFNEPGTELIQKLKNLIPRTRYISFLLFIIFSSKSYR